MVKRGKCRMCGKRRKVLAISDAQLERDFVCFECLAAWHPWAAPAWCGGQREAADKRPRPGPVSAACDAYGAGCSRGKDAPRGSA